MTSKEKGTTGKLREVGPWTEQVSSSGKKYYYNSQSGVSQWEKPDVWLESERKNSRENSKSQNKHRNGNPNGASDNHSHPHPKPSTSQNHHSDRHSSTSGSPFTPQATPMTNGVSRTRDRPSASKEDQPLAKRPYLDKSPASTRPAAAAVPTPLLPIPPLPFPPPFLLPPVLLDPPPQAPPVPTAAMDEPMDVADSPPPVSITQKSEISVPVPDVKPFDDTPYTRFYRSNLTTTIRKSLVSESTLSEIKKSQEKLHKTRIQLMELETSIVSVQSLVCTAQCKSILLGDKYRSLLDQLQSIKKQQFKTDSQRTAFKKGDTPISPEKYDQQNGGLDLVIKQEFKEGFEVETVDVRVADETNQSRQQVT